MNFTPLPLSQPVKNSYLLPISTRNVYNNDKGIKKSNRYLKQISSVPARILSFLFVLSVIAISVFSSELNPAPEYSGKPWTPIESFISMRTRPYASLTFEKPSLVGRTIIPNNAGVSFVVIMCATYMALVLLALAYLVFVYEAPEVPGKKYHGSDDESSDSESDSDSKDENLKLYKQVARQKRQNLRPRKSDPTPDRPKWAAPESS